MKTRLLFLIILFFLTVFSAGSTDSISELITEYARGHFGEILEKQPQFYSKEDFAIYNLLCIEASLKTSKEIPEKIIDNISNIEKPFKDYLLLASAKYFLLVGNFKRAESFIDKVDFSQIKSRELLYDSLRLKATIYDKQNSWSKEALVWDKIKKIEGISNSQKKEALFKEALCLKKAGTLEKALILLDLTAFDTQINPFGKSAFTEIVKINPQKLSSLSDEKKVDFSRQFLRNGRGGEALILLSMIEEKKRDVALWADCLYKVRKNEELLALSDSIVFKNQKPGDKEIQAVLKGLWATLRIPNIEKSKAYFDFITLNSTKESNALSEANYALGCIYYSEGNFKKCIPFFKEVVKDKKSKFYSNALFKMMLASYVEKKNVEGYETLIYKDNPFQERTLFFVKNFLNKEVVLPLSRKSFYSFVKDKTLKESILKYCKLSEKKFFNGIIDKESFAYKLYKSGFTLFALNEAEKKEKIVSKEDKITIKMLLAQSGNYCKEFKIPDEEISLAYPTPYNEEISQVAEKYGVEKSLMFAICRNESRFDRFAYSDTGAIGLFQIMPETASTLLQRDVSEEELFDPKLNSEVAALYLKKLQNIFSNRAMIISSYNAGEDAVLRWKSNFPEDETLFVLMIPYLETQNYTEKVLFDKMVYDCLEKE